MVTYAPQVNMFTRSEKPVVVAYLGPDTLLPLGSVLAGVAGVSLLFGRRAVALLRKAARKLGGKPPEEDRDGDGEEPTDTAAD